LLRKGVLSVFVFDGAGGPGWKRGRETGHSKGTVTQLERGFTALLSRMGIDWRKAPGEAEAELAAMCQGGLIDAVLTVSHLGGGVVTVAN
jgi:Holliday junction resolvase YEN1